MEYETEQRLKKLLQFAQDELPNYTEMQTQAAVFAVKRKYKLIFEEINGILAAEINSFSLLYEAATQEE